MDPTAPKLVHRRRSRQDRSACLLTQQGEPLLFMDGQIMGLSKPTDPKILSEVPPVGKGWGLRQAAVENRLYACRNTEFAVIDISDPQRPAKLGSLTIPSPGPWQIDVEHITVMGDRVLVPNGDEGLLLIDISDESAPRVAAQCPSEEFKSSYRSYLRKLEGKLAGAVPWSTGAIMSAQIVGSVAYVADYRGHIYEIAYPHLKSPEVVAQTYFGRGLHLSDGHLWRVTLDGLTIFDLSWPSEAPKVQGHATGSQATLGHP